MGAGTPKRAPRCLVALLAAALLLSIALGVGNSRGFLSRLKADDATCTLTRLEFPPVGPQLFLPAAGQPEAVLQTFVSRYTTLSGIEIGLLPLPGVQRVGGTLTLYDAQGAVVRRERFEQEEFSGGLLRIPFKPVAHPRNAIFSFSLVVDAALAGLVAAQGSRPTDYSEASLQINGERQPFSLFHRTVHPVRWPAKNLVAALEYAKLPYFIVVAVAGFLAYRLVSYRAIYLVVLLTSIYTAFAFLPYSRIDEEAHFDYVNHLREQHRLPLVDQMYAADELDALTAEIGNLQWSSYLWFGRRYEAVHPPLYYIVAASLASVAGVLTESIAVRFFLLRLLGALSLVVTAVLIGRTYELLVARAVIVRSDLLLFATLATFLLSPGFQATLIPVTNDQLTVPLASLQLYLVARLWFQERLTLSDLLLLSSVTGLLLLTRPTTAHIVVLVVIFLLAKRMRAGAVGYLFCSLLFVLPWLAFNQYHYGAPIGTTGSLGIASKSLDMTFSLSLRSVASATDSFIQDFLLSYDHAFLFPQKSGFAVLLATVWKFLVWSVVISYCGVLLAHGTRARRGAAAPVLPAAVKWGGFCLLGIGLKYLMMAAASWIYGFNSFYARHLYMDVLAAVFCIFIMAQRLGAWSRDHAAAADSCRTS